jgi:hypothetical protein
MPFILSAAIVADVSAAFAVFRATAAIRSRAIDRRRLPVSGSKKYAPAAPVTTTLPGR